MKAVYVAIASALLGAVVGAGISWANFSGTPPALWPALNTAANSGQPGTGPKLVVDNPMYDFGPVERDTTVRHVFRFTNIGQATLTLKAGATTCPKCTISALSRTQVPPGESSDVTVEYLTSYVKPRFRQTVTVLTNDPNQGRVELNIFGSVTTKFRTLPEQLVLSKISANETRTAEIKIYCYWSDDVRVVGHAFNDPETASYFEVQSQAIPPEELTDDKAKSGCRVELTIKPGLPLGPIRQTIRLELQWSGDEEKTKLEVPIEGVVVSDVSIVGPGWNDRLGRLSLGTVKRAAGTTRNVFLLFRGKHRHEATVEPVKVDPEWLKVTVGKPTELNDSVIQIPISIEIPRGRPPALYLGSEQEKYADITLGVKNVPQINEIHMDVQFVIE
jgi:hypothetical protein